MAQNTVIYINEHIMGQIEKLNNTFLKIFVQNDYYRQKKIVSVGCGLCQTEAILSTRFGIKRERFILVDPDPISFCFTGVAEPAMKIDYPSVTALVTEQPDIVQNCILFIWNATPGYTFYDLEAIRKLRPLKVILNVEFSGSTSSYLMQCWLDSLGLETFKKEHILPLLKNEGQERINMSQYLCKNYERWFPKKGTYILERNEINYWVSTEQGNKKFLQAIVVLTKTKTFDDNTHDKNFEEFESIYKEEIQNTKKMFEIVKLSLKNQ